jgi:hypothetical protein
MTRQRPPSLLVIAIALCVQPVAARAQAWPISLERLLSALRVDDAQTGTRSQQSANGYAMAAQGAASAITSQDNALRLARAQHTYGYDTGTGYAACTVALGIGDERAAHISAQKVRDAFRKSDQAWLTTGGDGAERMGISLQQRRELYCTADEQEAGWCRKSVGGGFGAGDSDAGPWLFNRNYGPEEIATAADYLDVIAPLPTVRPNPRTAEQDLELIVARRQGAVLTGARAILVGVIDSGMGGDRQQGSSTP